jgi:2-polyprenyl-6-methoxyphenol hydroxylase-like FAD-dependent oxidoreductase
VGVDAQVYERADNPRRTGGALLLWSNAIRVLGDLGLAEAVLERSTVLDVTEFRSWCGDTLWALPVDDLGRRHGAPTVVIPRSDLLDVLLEALPRGALHLGWRLDAIDQFADSVVARSSNGEAVHADALIGADGLHSAVRAVVLGRQAPASTGQIAWVGILDYAHLLLPPGVAMATLGEGLRFWAAGLEGGRVYWYATVKEEHGVTSLAQLSSLFCDAHAPIRDLIDGTAPSAVVRTKIQDRRPTPGWSRGRVTLVGDAAHPATPDIGQGACQALESGIVLAAHWKHARDVGEAFVGYEEQRFERCARMTLLARATAEGSAIEAPVFQPIRDVGVRSLLPGMALDQFDWILGANA